MSVLALLLPSRRRLGSRATAAEPGAAVARLPSQWSFVFSADGRSVSQQGMAAAALLPRADHTVLVLAEGEVSWHAVIVPRAPSARLRAALQGVLEEELLDEEEALHLALAPGAVAGSRGWVAVTHRPWLAAALGALESAGLSVERVVVAGSPDEAAAAPPRGHFFTADDGPESTPWLALTQAEGAVCLHLSGALARALRPPAGPAMRWTASPAAAAQAERWLGQPVALMTDAERALEAAAGTLNLRQFDLGARHRGTRALRDLGKRFLSAEWRAVRTGLVALLLLQLIGLNAQAWQQGQALAERRRAMTELLRQTHPGVRAVLDAPLQMQRETDRLRSAAGRPGEQDLEALMAAAASAWPDGQGPAPSLRFEAGRLTLGAAGWEAPQLQQFRQRLKGAGYSAESAEGRVTVARAPGGAGAAP